MFFFSTKHNERFDFQPFSFTASLPTPFLKKQRGHRFFEVTEKVVAF